MVHDKITTVVILSCDRITMVVILSRACDRITTTSPYIDIIYFIPNPEPYLLTKYGPTIMRLTVTDPRAKYNMKSVTPVLKFVINLRKIIIVILSQ